MKVVQKPDWICELRHCVFSASAILIVFTAIACNPETAKAAGAVLGPLVASANLDSLRWRGFRDGSGGAAKFYEGRGYAPAWVDGAGPTGQATVGVSILEKNDTKGQNPEDHDA